MIQRRISRETLLEKLTSMRYREVSELQVHSIFVEFGYTDKDHYMATEDNVNNNEQNET